MGKRRIYSREFKIEAVRLVLEAGLTCAEVGRDLDVHAQTIRRWKKEFDEDPNYSFPGHGRLKPEEEELRRLRTENRRLKMERDILKKAAAYFARESG